MPSIIIVVVHPFYSQLTFLWIFFAGKFGSSTNLLVLLRPPHHIISKRVLRQESSSVAASCSSLELLPLGIDVIGRLLWVPREHTRKGTQARTWRRSSCILPYYFYAFLYYILYSLRQNPIISSSGWTLCVVEKKCSFGRLAGLLSICTL